MGENVVAEELQKGYMYSGHRGTPQYGTGMQTKLACRFSIDS